MKINGMAVYSMIVDIIMINDMLIKFTKNK